MIYGGVDATSNALIIILSGVSSGQSASQILALTIAIVVGDGLVMGIADYLSAKAEIEFIKSE